MSILDDDAESPAESECATSPPALGGNVRPFHPLSALAGESIGGTWRLQVIDEGPDDIGTLSGWCLQLNSAAPQTRTPNPTPSPTPTSTGPGRLYCDTLPRPAGIPDNNPNGVTDTIVVPDSITITDLDVRLDITHTYVSDLVVTLMHADTATTVTLIDRPGIPETQMGCEELDISCTLDDQADRAAEMQCDIPPPAIGGRVRPNGRLSDFNGQSIAGMWQLKVSDLSGLDVGSLNRWCLVVNSG